MIIFKRWKESRIELKKEKIYKIEMKLIKKRIGNSIKEYKKMKKLKVLRKKEKKGKKKNLEWKWVIRKEINILKI